MGRAVYPIFIECLIAAVVVLLVGVRPISAQTVNLTDPTRVISGEDLQGLGVARLADLLYEIADARTLSLDGFTTQFSLGGIGTFHEAAPAVFVDGHPVENGLFASSDLNLIGVPVEVIDRVEIYARPSLISGVFAGQGALHIFTKKAGDAAELHGSARMGVNAAEAGHLDLGDGERTEHGFEGPDLELAGVGQVAGGSAMGAAVYHRHTHAERSIRSGRPLSAVISPSAVYTWTNQRVHLSLLGLGVAADRFAYASYASRVLRTDHQGAALSAMASHRIGDRGFLRHRATVDLSRTRHDRDPGPWKESAFFWTSALARTLEERIVVLGGSAELRRVHLGSAVEDVRLGSVFAAIAGRMAPGTQYRGGGAVAMDGRSVAVKAYGGIAIARWENHRLDVYLAIVDALLHEQNAADLWARNELAPPFFPKDATRPDQDVALRATFDAEWRWQVDALQELRIGAGIRRSEKIYLPFRSLRPTAAAGAFLESIEFHYTDGTQAVIWGEFTSHILPGRQQIFWNWQQTLVGQETYEAAWNALPGARLGVSFTTPMLGGFRMRGSVVRESGSSWNEFAAVSLLDSDLSGSTRLDVYVTKRLFSGRLNVRSGVQNALGEDILYHPLGDTFGRSFRVDVRFDFERR